MKLNAVWTALVLLSLSQGRVGGCGPGRGAGRRRTVSKLTPLVFKQHVPNVSENTLGASGLAEGRITRSDPRFKNLVPVSSEDIIFRDDEGTGADRLMTQRCMEKLNALAISVMNQWPGVKLRVVDGWEEERMYASESLHYEGRAVDITTSDKDRSKYGMLARLAVEAGFDWVYYETRAHIHCSVKSESSQAAKTGGCFSSNSTVTLEGGEEKRLSQVQVGDKILSYEESTGQLVYSEVLMFLDRDVNSKRQFLNLTMSGGVSLRVTPQHLIMKVVGNKTSSDEVQAVFAARLEVDDVLLIEHNGHLVRRRLLSSELTLDQGVVAPLTAAGTIVVDKVVASCYALFESQTVAHAAFSPVRVYTSAKHSLLRIFTLITHPIDAWDPTYQSRAPRSSTISTNESTQVGIHWYAKFLYSVSIHFIPDYLLYK